MSRRILGLVVVVCVVTCALFASSARAVHVASWVQRPISAAAIANDPALANMQSWSLMTSYDVGRWSSAGVRATLPAGSLFYQHPLGGSTFPDPNVVNAFPGLAFDTYVTVPEHINTIVLGGHPASPPPASFGGPTDPIPGTFSVSWGRSMGGAPVTGTFEIARLTFPQGVLPHILQGPPFTSQSISYTVVPEQQAFVGQIPEPAGAATIALCASAGLLRRRR
jgi:hypothetical protein